MSERFENVEVPQQQEPQDVVRRVMEMGKFVGMREAFAQVAGRCAAADIECLRRLRDSRMYRNLDCTWAEFCSKHLHVSKRNVDRLIGYFEEFGAAYFTLSKLTHIAVSEYRQIAAAVSEDGVSIDGSVVALLPENSEKLAAAVAALLSRINQPETAGNLLKDGAGPDSPGAPPSPESPVQRILAACEEVASTLRAVKTLPVADLDCVRAAIVRVNVIVNNFVHPSL